MKLPYRILVLEDDDAALEGIVEMLREAGYRVTGAATYEAAKRLIALDSYDLLITDIRLRGFNGLHLIRQTYRDHPEMGLIIITGYDEPMIQCVSTGPSFSLKLSAHSRPVPVLDNVPVDVNRILRSGSFAS